MSRKRRPKKTMLLDPDPERAIKVLLEMYRRAGLTFDKLFPRPTQPKEEAMPSKSEKQHKFMEAVSHNPKFAKKVGVPVQVGKEYVKADAKKGGKK